MPGKNFQFKRGFTLIELLVVIAIIGVLATLTIVSFGNAQEKTRDSRRKSDLDNLKKVLHLARQDTPAGYYFPGCVNNTSSCEISSDSSSIDVDIITNGYINSIPLDPSSDAAYFYDVIPSTPTSCSDTGVGNPSECTGFTLTACIENASDPKKDGPDSIYPYDARCDTSTGVSYTIGSNN